MKGLIDFAEGILAVTLFVTVWLCVPLGLCKLIDYLFS